jgi:hypothetical protein
VDVAPMLGRSVRRVDPKRLDDINRLQYPHDLPPAIETQQNLAAGPNTRNGRIALAWE